MKSLLFIVCLACSMALLFSCGKNEEEAEPTSTGPEVTITDERSIELETFTGGRHVKAVWARYFGGGANDVYTNHSRLRLWGIDTRDNLGPREIVGHTDNYSRPLISPDGEFIIYTDKNPEEKGKIRDFDPVVQKVDWKGEHIEDLGPGHAVEIWRDPETKTQWVYVTDLLPNDNPMMRGSKIERFNLYDPSERELVYDETEVTTDNIQLSQDGARASCLFPWPAAGVLDLTTGNRWKNQQGCWPSMSPDNRYTAWVFDGSHKTLHFFTDGGVDTWAVNITNAPGVDGIEVYHPRWSNNVRYFTMTGPYDGTTIGQSDGKLVNAYLGKFSPDLKAVESWVKITDDDRGDFYPDVWLGEQATMTDSLAETPQTTTAVTAAPIEKPNWPTDSSETLFVWENASPRGNARTSDGRESSVVAHEAARFDRHFAMRCDGGWFSTDPISGKLLTEYLQASSGGVTLEFVATPLDLREDGVLISHPFFQIRQLGRKLVFAGLNRFSGINELPALPLAIDQPTHYTMVISATGEASLYVYGKEITDLGPLPPEMVATRRGLSFGSGWSGALEGVALYRRALSPEEIAKNAASWREKIASRNPVPQANVRAKLVAITADRPPEALGEYQRGMLTYQYAVEEILSPQTEMVAVGDLIQVIHWTLLDQRYAAGFPRRPGQTFELLIENLDDHPELAGERKFTDLIEPDQFYEVSTPTLAQ